MKKPVDSTRFYRKTLAVVIMLLCAADGGAAENIEDLEQQAFVAAVDRVAPSVVRIETLGGTQRVGNVVFGSGPTTGLIVDADGYIVSSAFSFANRPSSILVRLPDGSRKPAKLVATDHNRKIALLKIETQRPLPVAQIAPQNEIRVGQWAIALGRTFDLEQPNMSVGIVSALDRIWGKAMQTDAAVSPNNYGGPLIDIHGRVMGLLVPLSPMSNGALAGYEWYDSGIGFAVPAEQIQQLLPRLRSGEDLRPGIIGIALAGNNLFTGKPVIGACLAGSPADKAGLKKGDRIVEIDGRQIHRAADVKRELNSRYAGDKVAVVVLREKKRIERSLELMVPPKPAKRPPARPGRGPKEKPEKKPETRQW
ncbi:MAG: trypsin-like peptidase domain-containing protein [Thermoguttaceae bacterium]